MKRLIEFSENYEIPLSLHIAMLTVAILISSYFIFFTK
jgi:hypothetical protein